MQKVDVWLIRHGETDWNAQRRMQGHTDIPLNTNGESQALTLQPLLARLRPQSLLCSDLSRAIKTAQIANQHLNLPLSIHPELRESPLGETEGKTIDEIISLYGQESWSKWGHDLDFAFPGGEPPRKTLERIKNFFAGHFQINKHLNKVAVITHGGVVKRMITHSKGAPSKVPMFLNCSINHMEFDRIAGHWSFKGPID